MNLSSPFIKRPVATVLLSIAFMVLGFLCYRLMPVSPMPEIEFPAISVSASLAGASPEVMAATVATPLERAFGQIAGVTNLSSSSSQGSTRVNLLFEANININNAARQVQAAINAAAKNLPDGMRTLPSIRKINPANAPIMALALTSDNLSKSELYDLASSVLAQAIAQVPGVGDVSVGGSSLPAVRVSLNPNLLNAQGISLDEVRRAISQNNIRKPHGVVADNLRSFQVQTNEQLNSAIDYQNIIIRSKNNAIVRLKDVADVTDGVENVYNRGFYNGEDAILITIMRETGANIIATIARIKELIPTLTASLPSGTKLEIAADRSLAITATLHEAERTLIIATALVILVIFLALGNIRASLIPACAVPLSLIVSSIFMYLAGFSLNVLTLTALILATGLVVDDAIVVLENIVRHIDAGKSPMQAALSGAKEVGFTLLAMNAALVTVFVAILLTGGIISRLFYEFSLSLAATIVVSLVVSLTLTPMLCAYLLKARDNLAHSKISWQQSLSNWYAKSLNVVLAHKFLALLLLFGAVILNIYLYVVIPKILLPIQDTGQITGFLRGDDGLSFNAMSPKVDAFIKHIQNDPAVVSVSGFIGGRRGNNNATLLVRLKPLAQRKDSVHKIVDRLRRSSPKIAGARLFLMPTQDLRFGRMSENSSSEYQITVQSDDISMLRKWMPQISKTLNNMAQITAVDGKSAGGTEQITLEINRQSAKRLGVDMDMISSVLNNSFSQRQVATIYQTLNQYKVVMEIDQKYAKGASSLDQVQVIASDGKQIPLSAIATYSYSLENDSVHHVEQFLSEDISFDVTQGVSLDDVIRDIKREFVAIGLPSSLIVKFGGTADVFQSAQQNQMWLLLSAIVAVYLVLGILYESYLHPLTILSTLPTAGVGAMLALLILGQPFSLISLLGMFLLIGIVMKNAILMIDIALQLKRANCQLTYQTAIIEACLLRLRPILMTTLAAICGAIPLLLSNAEGAEMRTPLGISIIGGLMLSQVLTLYSTPVVFVCLEKAKAYMQSKKFYFKKS